MYISKHQSIKQYHNNYITSMKDYITIQLIEAFLKISGAIQIQGNLENYYKNELNDIKSQLDIIINNLKD